MWKLSKLKKGILEISSIKVEFEDTFSSVHLRDYYIDKYRLKPPCKVDKVLMPTTYQSLLDLITEINLFKPREEVPNRMVQTDIPGRSKLIRSHDKGTITLAQAVGLNRVIPVIFLRKILFIVMRTFIGLLDLREIRFII